MTTDALGAFSMRGRLVMVVGGTRGIGRAITLQLARAGAVVIANYARDRESAELLTTQAQTEGLDITTLRADVSNDKGRDLVIEAVSQKGRPLSSLVFAAATGVHRPFDQFTSRHFDFTFELNVKTFLLLVQRLTASMSAGGSIVALSSEGAARAMPQYGLVGASKAALESIARHLAVELAPHNIRVNVLSPGTVVTDAWKVLPDAESRLAEAAARAPTGKLTSLQDVATAAHFLCCEASAGMVGHTMVVDGGARVLGSC